VAKTFEDLLREWDGNCSGVAASVLDARNGVRLELTNSAGGRAVFLVSGNEVLPLAAPPQEKTT
jgi:hypothetical protein